MTRTTLEPVCLDPAQAVREERARGEWTRAWKPRGSGLILCTKCKGLLTLEDDTFCPRCQDEDGIPTGIDPEAHCGCTEEYEETREEWHEHLYSASPSM